MFWRLRSVLLVRQPQACRVHLERRSTRRAHCTTPPGKLRPTSTSCHSLICDDSSFVPLAPGFEASAHGEHAHIIPLQPGLLLGGARRRVGRERRPCLPQPKAPAFLFCIFPTHFERSSRRRSRRSSARPESVQQFLQKVKEGAERKCRTWAMRSAWRSAKETYELLRPSWRLLFCRPFS